MVIFLATLTLLQGCGEKNEIIDIEDLEALQGSQLAYLEAICEKIMDNKEVIDSKEEEAKDEEKIYKSSGPIQLEKSKVTIVSVNEIELPDDDKFKQIEIEIIKENTFNTEIPVMATLPSRLIDNEGYEYSLDSFRKGELNEVPLFSKIPIKGKEHEFISFKILKENQPSKLIYKDDMITKRITIDLNQ